MRVQSEPWQFKISAVRPAARPRIDSLISNANEMVQRSGQGAHFQGIRVVIHLVHATELLMASEWLCLGGIRPTQAYWGPSARLLPGSVVLVLTVPYPLTVPEPGCSGGEASSKL